MRARHAHPDALSMQAKLAALNLPFMRENYQPLANTAADKHWSHVDYFTELLAGEAAAREDRRVQRDAELLCHSHRADAPDPRAGRDART